MCKASVSETAYGIYFTDMNRVNTLGYTILEAMIFLAVSGAMFVSVALLIGGQQAKAEFQHGIRNFESQIQDIANDVSTGYYATDNSFTCTANPGAQPVIGPGAADRGTNKDCIFIGRALQFSPGGAEANIFYVYEVVGTKKTDTKENVKSLAEAKPKALGDFKERNQIPGGITVEWVKYGPPLVPTDGFGIFTTFGVAAGGSSQKNGTVSVNLVPVAGPDFVTNIGSLDDTNKNPPSGIQICLKSNRTDQSVLMTMGGQGRTFGTKTEFHSGSNCGVVAI